MNPKVKAILEQRAKLVQEMHDLTNNDGSWNTRDGKSAAEASKRWSELNAQQEGLAQQARTIEAQEKLDAEMKRVNAPPNPQVATGGPGERGENMTENETRAFEILNSPEYRSEFVGWVRTGRASTRFESMCLEARVYAGLNTGSGASGEFLIPIGFQRELEVAMKAYGGMRRNSRVVPTSTGNPLHWPKVDDTSNQGRWLSEAAPVQQTNPTFDEQIYNAYLASSDQVLVSVQLLQDSAFDIESLLAQLLGIRMGRLTDAGYTTGDGSGKPTGIITSILADSQPRTVTATGSSANDGIVGNTGANSIGTDDFASLISAIDPTYRTNAKFLAHWSIFDYLKKVKDKFGRPLFVAGTSSDLQDRIFGEQYDWSGAMDAASGGLPVAGSNAVLYGDFSKYIVRDVLGMTMVRYNELYMPNHQVGFQAYLRTDGKRLQERAFSLLVMHT